jgi:hypothetical protein
MIDNFNLIKPFLTFENEHEFYSIVILERKKDKKEIGNMRQSVRMIKSYCIESVESLERKEGEIKSLCDMFGARAYINLSVKNHENVAHEILIKLSVALKSKQFNQKNIFESAAGKSHSDRPVWVVDIDGKADLDMIKDLINKTRPIGDKILLTLPTKNGFHFITKRFDIKLFNNYFHNLTSEGFSVEIKKNNPTLLYLNL